MTPTKLQLPQFLRFTERRSLSMYLMLVGLIITTFFIFIAIFAPVFQAWGWLQDPT
ncbi:MAG: ABC transporter permease, partial [Coleofasciculaceae cyanobacterium]